MSSFTILIKDEICHKDFESGCQKAILAAALKLHGIIAADQTKITIQSFHNKTIKLLYQFLKQQYPNIELELLTTKYHKLRRYGLVIHSLIDQVSKDLLLQPHNDWYINQKHLKNHCLRAFVAGLFLVAGSMNSPQTSNYHLELQFSDPLLAKAMQKFLLKKFKFTFKTIVRRNKYVLYLKKSNDISDFLKLLDCPEAVFTFEDKRITRELLNTINRFNNIDISNQQKIINTGTEQVKMIMTIKEQGVFNELSSKCQALAELRLQHQDVSLVELGVIYYQITGEVISKSGVNHLMRELKKKYQELLS